jgi:hypothetical protein
MPNSNGAELAAGEVRLMKELVVQRARTYRDKWHRTKIIADWEKDIKQLKYQGTYSIVICPKDPY